MFKNSMKLLFLCTLATGTLISVSANSWLSAWMGLEINLLSFIPLMINTNNLMSTEASLKYFLTQTIASSLLLFSIIIYMFFSHIDNFIMNSNNYYSFLMINSTLMLKSGAAPFHFWFPGVMEGLTWMNNLILMTWQKIAPLMLISYCILPKFFSFIIISSCLIGSLGGLNQTSLRKLMAFSSINHLGWMLAAMISKETLWMIYFTTYSFLSFTMVFIFNSFKLFHLNQIFSFQLNSPIMKICLFLSLLSLGGLPPFLGFMPKWLVIQNLSMNNFIFLTFIMVCLTLITLYFYIRICYASFMFNYWEISWKINFHFNNWNMKIMLILTFMTLNGLILINWFYFM